PAVGSLFQGQVVQHICAGRAKRTEVTDLHAVQKSDQPGGEAIAERLVPRQRTGVAFAAEARTARNVCAPLDYRGYDHRQLRSAAAVVSVKKNDYLRVFGIRE